MPICSYIVYPTEGKVEDLKKQLTSLPGCQVLPAENRDVIILITDTKNLTEENHLQTSLKRIDEIQSLALTFGNIESEQQGGRT